jgi:hypothetical protein
MADELHVARLERGARVRLADVAGADQADAQGHDSPVNVARPAAMKYNPDIGEVGGRDRPALAIGRPAL